MTATGPKDSVTRLWIFDLRPEGALIRLDAVTARLPLEMVDAWQVRELKAIGLMPFEVPLPTFEDLVRRLEHGVLLTPAEFAVFQGPEVEIWDGEFIALSFRQSRATAIAGLADLALVALRNVDSSLWECETDDPEIIAAIRREFRDVRDPVD